MRRRRRRDRTRSRGAARAAGSSRSRPRPSTGSAPTRANRDAVRPAVRGEGPAGRPPGDRAPRATPTQLDEWAADVARRRARARRRVLARPAHARACRATERVPDEVTGGRDTVGLRVPGPAAGARAARAFGGGRRGAVGEPVRAGEPDDRGATCAPISATTSTLVLDGGPVPRRRRVDDRRLHRRRARDPARSAASTRERDRGVDRRARSRHRRGDGRARRARCASHYAPTRRVEVVDAGDAARPRVRALRRRRRARRRARARRRPTAADGLVRRSARRATPTSTRACSTARSGRPTTRGLDVRARGRRRPTDGVGRRGRRPAAARRGRGHRARRVSS